jgi:hypothetical protein
MLVMWMAIRRPQLALIREQGALYAGGSEPLRRAWYLQRLAAMPAVAKESRVFGLGGWLVDRYRSTFLMAMAAPWAVLRRLDRAVLFLSLPVLLAFGVAKLVALAVVLAAAAGAFSVLLSWYYQPYFAAGNQALGLNEDSPFVTLYNLREVAFPAWTLAAFTIGALAGMLIRRVVPAIVATLAAYAGLAVATGGFLREHYLTPLVTTSLNVPGTAWITSQ